jgi:hypothetical protein
MANVLYTTLLPEVAPHANGAPESIVINAIRNACIEFCERAWCWQIDTTPMSVASNVQDYNLVASLPAQSAIASIMYGYFNGKPIDPITKEEVNLRFPNWKTQVGQKPMRYLAGDVMTKVSLIPIPSTNLPTGVSGTIVPNGLFFTIALKPTRASTGLPDFIVEKYLEDLANGAIFRTAAIPGRGWSNANMALARKSLFDNGIANARQDSSKSYTRANLRNINTGVARW